MSCQATHEHLLDYHHGELDPAERAAVAAHLTACGECARAYCALDADLAAVRAGVLQTPPPALHTKLRARVQREFRPAPWRLVARWFTLPIPAYQAALALLLVTAVWWWMPASRSPAAPEGARPSAQLSTPARIEAPAHVRGSLAKDPPPALPFYDASRIVALDPNIF